MLKRRLFVLLALLCLLGLVSSASADSDVYCTCAMQCRGGKAGCESVCYGGDFFERAWLGAICCQQAEEATGPIDCGATPVESAPATPAQ